METLGVHTEVGKLRTVLVCRPGLAHQRLTPGNRADLLFDDVLWVHEAENDHYDFVLKMRERGTEVLELHELLAETLADKAARAWVLDRRVTVNDVGPGLASILRAWLDELPAAKLAEHLIGGMASVGLPLSEQVTMLSEALGGTDFVIPPVPNTLFQRDPSCWIYDGVTCNPMYWPARKPETLLQRMVYKFHPRFKDADFTIWWGDSDASFGAASLEGGEVMPVGKGVVLIGMGERSTRQAVFQVARELFRRQAATRVIGCLMPKSRAAMHLDTVFTFCDRDLCTAFREVADQIRCYSARPDGKGGIEVHEDKGHLFDVVKEALMSFNLRNRSLLTVQDYTPREFRYLLDLARDLKRAKYARTEQKHLDGKEICLIFEKTSTRTRCAFEVACYDQGAHVTYLDPSGSQIGHKESFKDTARVLGRMYDAIEYRGASQEGVEQLAKYAGVPVFNGLTAEYHPTQMLADVMTMREHSDRPIHEIKYAFLGDTRNNMGHSLMIVGCLTGMDVRICGPKKLWPADEYVTIAKRLQKQSGARLTITDDPKKAVDGVDFVHTDVWVSMGEPKEVWKERIDLLLKYQVGR